MRPHIHHRACTRSVYGLMFVFVLKSLGAGQPGGCKPLLRHATACFRLQRHAKGPSRHPAIQPSQLQQPASITQQRACSRQQHIHLSDHHRTRMLDATVAQQRLLRRSIHSQILQRLHLRQRCSSSPYRQQADHPSRPRLVPWLPATKI